MSLYIGVRVEVANRIANLNKLKNYNRKHTITQVFDVIDNGRITVEKTDQMIIARGKKNEKGSSGLVNFSVMIKQDDSTTNIERVVKIINCLGNEKLIRERIFTFVNNNSLLNNIPELSELIGAFKDIDLLMPGFINSGWYYAPEAIFK